MQAMHAIVHICFTVLSLGQGNRFILNRGIQSPTVGGFRARGTLRHLQETPLTPHSTQRGPKKLILALTFDNF